MDRREIAILGFPAEEMRGLLLAEVQTADIDLEVRSSPHRFKGPVVADISTLVAISGWGSAALVALVAGLCRVLERRQGGVIEIKGADGTTIKVPANTPFNEIEKLFALAATLREPHIQIVQGVVDLNSQSIGASVASKQRSP